jgi:hypothetical protein
MLLERHRRLDAANLIWLKPHTKSTRRRKVIYVTHRPFRRRNDDTLMGGGPSSKEYKALFFVQIQFPGVM